MPREEYLSSHNGSEVDQAITDTINSKTSIFKNTVYASMAARLEEIENSHADHKDQHAPGGTDSLGDLYQSKSWEEISTPASPISGYKKIYPKSDGKFYKLDSSGVETCMESQIKSEEFIATAGQTLFTLTNGTYTVGTNTIFVVVDGVPQAFSSFTQTSSISFTLSEASVGGELVFVCWYSGVGIITTNEIEDARNSLVKGKTFPTIDGRFESIEQQLGYHSKDIGMVGNDSINDATVLNTWITSIGSSKCTLFLSSGTYKIATNVVLPSNVIIKPLYGAIIKVYSGYSITGTNTKIEAGLYQIFDLSLGGTVVGTWDIKEVYPEWFGAKGDGVTDDTNAIQSAIDLCIAKNGGTVTFSKGIYMVEALTCQNTNNISFKGEGQNISIIKIIAVINLSLIHISEPTRH